MTGSDGKVPFKVAIIGGGISGMTLALALLNRKIPFTVYEQYHAFKEIGAGVGLTANAVKAMDICSPVLREAFDKVATGNVWPSKKGTYMDMIDGYTHPTETRFMYSMKGRLERKMLFRADFLDYLVEHIPPECAVLGKRLDKVAEQENGDVLLEFHDGSTATADIVIGCDGIKSQVRKAVIDPNNNDHPALHPVYTGVYAYRGLIPVKKSIPVIGEDFSMNSKIISGKDGHFILFPVRQNTVLNVAAYRRDAGEWTHPKFTRRASREEAERDYAEWCEPVRKLVGLLEPDLDVWAIYDTADHPLPRYSNGRICVLGDAAHASSPHLGSGAGMCIEDCAIMVSLLDHPRIREAAAAMIEGSSEEQSTQDQNGSPGQNGTGEHSIDGKTAPVGATAEARSVLHRALSTALETFNQVRIERSQGLVESSRRMGELYDWRPAPTGPADEAELLKEEVIRRHDEIWDADVLGMVKEAARVFDENYVVVSANVAKKRNPNRARL